MPSDQFIFKLKLSCSFVGLTSQSYPYYKSQADKFLCYFDFLNAMHRCSFSAVREKRKNGIEKKEGRKGRKRDEGHKEERKGQKKKRKKGRKV